jgi:hypothetical protein
MRRALSWLAWWAVLLLGWFAYDATIERVETFAGLASAAVGATAAEVVRSQGLLRFRTDPAWLARVWRVPWLTLVEFGVVTAALARHFAGRRVHGKLIEVPFPVGGDDPQSAWRRGFVGTAETISPNSIVVEFDRERKCAVLHVLVDRPAAHRIL